MTKRQVNYALGVIEKRHHCKDAPIYVTWPWLNYICCCCFNKKKQKKTFRNGLKWALRKKLGLKVSKNEKLAEENPFLHLGYGMSSYFSLMLQLLMLMAMLSCFAIPLMMVYAKGSGLIQHPGYGLAQFSIGNLGGAST